MTTPTNPIEPFTPFLPTTYNVPQEDDRLTTFLVDNLSDISDVVNDKKIGIYLQNAETLNGNKLFYDNAKVTRNGYQFLARIKQYPNNGTITLLPPPNINPQFVVFQVWGSASKAPMPGIPNSGDFFSFYGEGNSKITFTFTETEIMVTTTALLVGTYTGFIIVDYVRNGI